MRKLLTIFPCAAMLGMTGCLPRALPDFSKAERVEIAYYQWHSTELDKGNWKTKYEHKAQLVLDQKDTGVVLDAVAALKPGRKSKCPFGGIEIIVYLEDKAYRFFPAMDGCGTYGYGSADGPCYEGSYEDADLFRAVMAVFGRNDPEGENGEFYDWTG